MPLSPQAHGRLASLRRWGSRCALLLAALPCLAGCGTTQQNQATQQLLESDAIDAAISRIDFTPLSGRKVYFDDSYLKDYKGVGFVNSNYVISGLRQQVLSAGCLLQEKRDEAEVILEGRIGALGSDQHDVVYGVPKNNALNGVAAAVPGSPALPALPELALAKKAASLGAAKLAVFAYDRETREPVWQSGLSIARSTAKNTWILGAGPYQHGTIHRDDMTLGEPRSRWKFWRSESANRQTEAFLAYELPRQFSELTPVSDVPADLPASDRPAAESLAAAPSQPASVQPPANSSAASSPPSPRSGSSAKSEPPSARATAAAVSPPCAPLTAASKPPTGAQPTDAPPTGAPSPSEAAAPPAAAPIPERSSAAPGILTADRDARPIQPAVASDAPPAMPTILQVSGESDAAPPSSPAAGPPPFPSPPTAD